MKRHATLVSLCFIFILTTSLYAKHHEARLSVKYSITSMPGACLYPDNLPAGCTAIPSSEVCTVNVGIYQKTYYQGAVASGCITPYYLLIN